MMRSENIPDWYKSFREWFECPSPTGEWLYRGQAAKYSSLLPSLLREPNKKFYRNMLYDYDYQIADTILLTSPALSAKPLYSDVVTDELDLEVSRLFGVPPRWNPSLSIPEIIRALAQHYGFPTLFVDLTRNPIVAAFFATHTYSKGRYTVRDDEPGVVYRWPAVRVSRARLKIPIGEKKEHYDYDTIDAFDLSSINNYFRRPRNQTAVLAAPVVDPLRPWFPPLFASSPDDLIIFDMAKLSCCEHFQLPAGGGYTLTKLNGVTSEAMFPDLIDLGNSYLSIIALLSLITHSKKFEEGILAGRIIGDRECFRLVPRCSLTETTLSHTLHDAEALLLLIAKMAREATHLMKSEEVLEATGDMVKKKWEAAIKNLKERREVWNEVVREVRGNVSQEMLWSDVEDIKTFEEKIKTLKLNSRDIDTDWIITEIDRRFKRVHGIIQTAKKVPCYALLDQTNFHNLVDAFPSDSEYEKEVALQVAAQRLWIKEEPIFPPLV